jgi:uncharacterized protein involved in exopolysaccharide biosynthesis
MEVLVNRERQDPMVTAEVVNQTPSATPPVAEEELNSEVELLQSPDLLRQVVISTGLCGTTLANGCDFAAPGG